MSDEGSEGTENPEPSEPDETEVGASDPSEESQPQNQERSVEDKKRPDFSDMHFTPEQLERLQQVMSQPWLDELVASQFQSGLTQSLSHVSRLVGDIQPNILGAGVVEELLRTVSQNIALPSNALFQVARTVAEFQSRQSEIARPLIESIANFARNAALAGYATKTQEWLTSTETLRYAWNRPVWHYTNGYALLSILKTHSLWASSPQSLNDSSEMQHGFELIQEAFQRVRDVAPTREEDGDDDPDVVDWEMASQVIEEVLDRQYFSSIRNDVYYISASANPDSLTLWRNYADGDGFAIGIDAAVELSADGWDVDEENGSDTRSDIPPISGWYKVQYKPNDKRRLADEFVNNAIQDIWRAGKRDRDSLISELRKQAVILASVMKHEAFQDEREVRWITTNFIDFDLVRYEHGRRSIVPVLHIKRACESRKEPLPLKGVRCSPIPDQSIVGTIQGLLRHEGYIVASEDVQQSEQPFRG